MAPGDESPRELSTWAIAPDFGDQASGVAAAALSGVPDPESALSRLSTSPA